MGGGRWIRPEVYPLFAAIGAAVGLCGFCIFRNLAINPDVRINRDDRSAGVLENYSEGKSYKDHPLRMYVENRSPEIMPAINKYFSTSK
ncbi:hypothetical protein R1sor_001733 [Riccia sorocarpa]|uniref:Uncharacterized protein n=1 Tax=Riccia sorocarpa TaxID=122646 RepID=A0ABD3H100_9MARC